MCIHTGNATYTDWCICDDLMVCVNFITYHSVRLIFDTIMPKFGRNLDQTSTPQCRSLVEVPTKLRHWGGRSLVEIPTKLRHPQCRSLVEVWCRSLVDILSHLLCVSLIYRANFDQTSTLGVSKFGWSLVEVWSKFRHWGVSKFGRNLDQTSTPQCRSLVEISAKLRHPSVEHMHI